MLQERVTLVWHRKRNCWCVKRTEKSERYFKRSSLLSLFLFSKISENGCIISTVLSTSIPTLLQKDLWVPTIAQATTIFLWVFCSYIYLLPCCPVCMNNECKLQLYTVLMLIWLPRTIILFQHCKQTHRKVTIFVASVWCLRTSAYSK